MLESGKREDLSTASTNLQSDLPVQEQDCIWQLELQILTDEQAVQIKGGAKTKGRGEGWSKPGFWGVAVCTSLPPQYSKILHLLEEKNSSQGSSH